MHTFCQPPVWRRLFHLKVARGTLCHFPGDTSIFSLLCFQKSSDPSPWQWEQRLTQCYLCIRLPSSSIRYLIFFFTWYFFIWICVMSPPHDILSANDPGGVQLSEHIPIRCLYETKKSQTTSLVDFHQMVLSSKLTEERNFYFPWVCRVKDLEIYKEKKSERTLYRPQRWKEMGEQRWLLWEILSE